MWQRLVIISLHSNQKHRQITIEITFVKLKEPLLSFIFIDLFEVLMVQFFLVQIKTFYRLLIDPVPAGTNRPTITFSFNPTNLSVLPLIAASVRTLVVS